MNRIGLVMVLVGLGICMVGCKDDVKSVGKTPEVKKVEALREKPEPKVGREKPMYDEIVEHLETGELVVGGETFVVELAYKEQTRMIGMMFRGSVGENEGMLFLFNDDVVRSFHMLNCLVDLDILFIRPDGSVASLMTMKAPMFGERSLSYPSEEAVQFALELKAGTIKRLGLKVGDVVEIPKWMRELPIE